VDCCTDPRRSAAPLTYLKDLGIDVAEAVKLIVATHWHDDHVRGISDVLRECESADFAISGALETVSFLKLVALYRGRVTPKGSGLSEFARVFEILDERKQIGALLSPPKLAVSDKLLFRAAIPLPKGTVEAKVFSLSPSDASILKAQLAFAGLLPAEGECKRRICSPSPNHLSVVLWVEVGDHRALLGSDLEKTDDPKTGWSAILDDSNVLSGRAGVFKVPHHGGESAHEPRVWSDLLSEEPFAALTPFCRGDRLLPTRGDIRRITTLTSHAYATAPALKRRHKWTNRVVRDLVGQVSRDMHSVFSGWGQIRLRRDISEPVNSWQIRLFGNALRLES
jgi:hypothetical protein